MRLTPLPSLGSSEVGETIDMQRVGTEIFISIMDVEDQYCNTFLLWEFHITRHKTVRVL